MKIYLIILLFVFTVKIGFAQMERKVIREGNKAYKNSQYGNAVVSYEKAKKLKAESFEAGFNLGDALYKQKKYEDRKSTRLNSSH